MSWEQLRIIAALCALALVWRFGAFGETHEPPRRNSKVLDVKEWRRDNAQGRISA
jgi:hypothetical protein